MWRSDDFHRTTTTLLIGVDLKSGGNVQFTVDWSRWPDPNPQSVSLLNVDERDPGEDVDGDDGPGEGVAVHQ